MHSKKIWSLLLLFVMGFTVVHEYVYTTFDNDHCTTQEYISELSTSNDHGDLCDIHFEYHSSYILVASTKLILPKKISSAIKSPNILYSFDSLMTLLKPPITT